MPAGELCFYVSAGAPEHAKLEAVGGDAGWLWFCILAYCKRNKNDGVFPESKVPKMSDRRQPMKLLTRLAEEGLAHEPGHDCKKCVQPMPGYYVLHDWLYWQGSAAQETAGREARESGGSYGNHRRWHTSRGIADPTCEHCASLMRSDTGSHNGSHKRSVEGSDTRSGSDPSTDRVAIAEPNRLTDGSEGQPPHPPHTPPTPPGDITPPTPQAEPKRRTRRHDYDYASDLDFLRFWDVFPQKSGKPAAFKAWRAALDRGAGPDAIITAARAYRDDPNRNPAKTKYPQGWLNDERYNDEPPAGGTRERSFDF